MAIVNVEESRVIPFIKVALEENLRVKISYSSSPDEEDIYYEFILMENDNNKFLDQMIKCVAYTSIKEDPLKLYGSVKDMDEFLEYLKSPRSPSKNLLYNKKVVKIYPKDWYECFEDEKTSPRITEITKKIPSLVEKSKNVVIVPKEKPSNFDNIWDFSLSTLSSTISMDIRAEDKKAMDSLLASAKKREIQKKRKPTIFRL